MNLIDPFGSVTAWIRQLGSDQPEPAAVLWKRFEPQLVAFIIRIMRRGPNLGVGEDAVANSVFQSLIRLARQGKLDRTHRDGFWKVMKTIASRHLIDLRRRENRQKRGSGSVITESVVRDNSSAAHEFLDQFPAKGDLPDITAMTAELLSRMSELLDQEQQTILNLRLSGYTIDEIATQIEKSKPTVERKLRLIRESLKSHFKYDEGSDAIG